MGLMAGGDRRWASDGLPPRELMEPSRQGEPVKVCQAAASSSATASLACLAESKRHSRNSACTVAHCTETHFLFVLKPFTWWRPAFQRRFVQTMGFSWIFMQGVFPLSWLEGTSTQLVCLSRSLSAVRTATPCRLYSCTINNEANSLEQQRCLKDIHGEFLLLCLWKKYVWLDDRFDPSKRGWWKSGANLWRDDDSTQRLFTGTHLDTRALTCPLFWSSVAANLVHAASLDSVLTRVSCFKYKKYMH